MQVAALIIIATMTMPGGPGGTGSDSACNPISAIRALDGSVFGKLDLQAFECLQSSKATIAWSCSELARRLGSSLPSRYASYAYIPGSAANEQILGIRDSGFCRRHLRDVLTLLAGTPGGAELIRTLTREEISEHAEILEVWLRRADLQIAGDILRRAASVHAEAFLDSAARYVASRQSVDRVINAGDERREWSLVAGRALLDLGAGRRSKEPGIRAGLERCIEIIESLQDDEMLRGRRSPQELRDQMVDELRAVLKGGEK